MIHYQLTSGISSNFDITKRNMQHQHERRIPMNDFKKRLRFS